MRIKSIFVAGIIGAMLLATMPFLATTILPGDNPIIGTSTAEAARGGVKFSPRPAAPKIAPAPKAPAASDAGKSVSGNGNAYAPSKSASQLEKNAPAPGSANPGVNSANKATTQTATGTGLGGMMRNMGLLAGGMFLGSMLASMFGLGEGFFAEMLGIMANVAIFMLGFMLLRAIWNRFRAGSSQREEVNPYRSNAPTNRAAPAGNEFKIVDITPPNGAKSAGNTATSRDFDYNPRQMADSYRSR